MDQKKRDTLLTLEKGMDAFAKRIKKGKRLYARVLKLAVADKSKEKIFRLGKSPLFDDVMNIFGGALDPKKAEVPLSTIYDVGLHKETGSLIIANKGATLYALSPRFQTPYLTRHIGCWVYTPGLGIELVNVGLVGDVYRGKVVLRSESACTPSFLFGSQRCNCAYQWESIREVAAWFNKIAPPPIKEGEKFEKWVQQQCVHENGRHVFRHPGPGFILLHIDTQNGMGSGYTEDEFCFDLYTRASMRHRGEYTSEQVLGATMAGGFTAIGITPDPRKENGQIGYQVTRVILDFLGTSERVIFLTNNQYKMDSLVKGKYMVSRIKTLGAVNIAGEQEAEQRGTEFHHLDIDGTAVSLEDEIKRLKAEIEEKLAGG